MKYRLITTIALALIGQLVNAGDIIDTYDPGDTLTATTMDNIKTAVNSKQDRVFESCPPEQSIRVINADGTVECEVDNDSITRFNVVTIVGSTTIIDSSFGCAIARCPASHPVATGGGVSPDNLLTMVVTSSTPRISDSPVDASTPDGEYLNPDGWQGCAVNNSGASAKLIATAICVDF